LAENIRRVVAEVPGFIFLKSRIEDESTTNEDKQLEYASSKGGVDGQRSLDTSVIFGENSSVSTSPNGKVDFRPDMPYNGANKIAYESQCMRHTTWKTSFPNKGTEKRPSSSKSKPKKFEKLKKFKHKKCSGKSTPTSNKKTTKGTNKRKAQTMKKKGSKKKRRR